MANENKKDFNAMLADNKDMPKIKINTAEAECTLPRLRIMIQ